MAEYRGWETEVPEPSASYSLCPAGSYPAAFVGLIDLGRHEDRFGDREARLVRKVFLVWEVLDEKDGGDKPYFLGQRFTHSLHEKAKLGMLVRTMTGADLKPGARFNLHDLVGKKCLLTVTHKESKKKKPFAVVDAVAPLPKKMPAGEPTVAPVVWQFANGVDKIPTAEWIPWVHGRSLRSVLEESDEWAEPAAAAAESGIPY